MLVQPFAHRGHFRSKIVSPKPHHYLVHREGGGTVISADFNDDAKARAFKDRFDSERPEPERVTG